jgi:ubiquinol-cytochrome c reductase cytochrome c subunit
VNRVSANSCPGNTVKGSACRLILKMAVVAVLVLPGSSASAQQTTQAPSRKTPAGNAENGRHLFMKVGCYECHGTVAQGGVGPRLAPRPLDLDAFVAFVRKPLGRGMPPYASKVLSDSDLGDIHAYLQTIPKPPPVKSIPLLNQ